MRPRSVRARLPAPRGGSGSLEVLVRRPGAVAATLLLAASSTACSGSATPCGATAGGYCGAEQVCVCAVERCARFDTTCGAQYRYVGGECVEDYFAQTTLPSTPTDHPLCGGAGDGGDATDGEDEDDAGIEDASEVRDDAGGDARFCVNSMTARTTTSATASRSAIRRRERACPELPDGRDDLLEPARRPVPRRPVPALLLLRRLARPVPRRGMRRRQSRPRRRVRARLPDDVLVRRPLPRGARRRLHPRYLRRPRPPSAGGCAPTSRCRRARSATTATRTATARWTRE